MKKKFILITKFNKSTGFGNFVRCVKFYKYLEKNYDCSLYVKTKSKYSSGLKKYFKNFNLLKNKKLKLDKNCIVFLDYPRISRRLLNTLRKGCLVCYGNNNYFNYKNKIVPFYEKNKKNSSIFYSITGKFFLPINYTSKRKLFFFIYLSTNFKLKFLKNIIKIIRKNFSNKIFIYAVNNNLINYFKEKKNIKFVKALNANYIKNNMIYIGNIGSGGVDMAIRNVFSFTFSKNEDEIKIFQSLKKYHKKLFFFGNINKFDYKKFENKINYLNSNNYPLYGIKKNYFKNNNLKLEKKILSLIAK